MSYVLRSPTLKWKPKAPVLVGSRINMGRAFATAPSVVINYAGLRRASSSWGTMFEAELWLGPKDEETNDIVEVFKDLNQDLKQSSDPFKQCALFLNLEIENIITDLSPIVPLAVWKFGALHKKEHHNWDTSMPMPAIAINGVA